MVNTSRSTNSQDRQSIISSLTHAESWNSELWDKGEAADSAVVKEISNLDSILKFMDDMAKIEAQYCKEACKLIDKYLKNYVKDKNPGILSNILGRGDKKHKTYDSNKDKRREEVSLDDEKLLKLSSVEVAFAKMLKNSRYVVEQHKFLAYEIDEQILKNSRGQSEQYGIDLKKIRTELRSSQKQKEEAFKSFEGTESAYKASCHKCVNRKQIHAEKESDPNISQEDTKHAFYWYQNELQNVEQCKQEYAKQLEDFNYLQSEFYNSTIPKHMDDFQALHKNVGKTSYRAMLDYQTYNKRLTRQGQEIDFFLSEMNQNVGEIDINQDQNNVIEMSKSGFPRPGSEYDYVYKDYAKLMENNEGHLAIEAINALAEAPKRKREQNGNITRSMFHDPVLNSRRGLPFPDKDPQQRKRLIEIELSKINESKQKEEKSLRALEQLKQTYHDSRLKGKDMGDPNKVQKQIDSFLTKLSEINTKQMTYQEHLRNVNEQLNLMNNSSTEGSQGTPRSNLSTHFGALDQSFHSANSNKSNTKIETITTITPNGSSSSKEKKSNKSSGFGLKNLMKSKSKAGNVPSISTNQYQTDSTLKATQNTNKSLPHQTQRNLKIVLYDFDDSETDGCLPVRKDMILEELEEDSGGWTFCRIANSNSETDEGFVPTNYIDDYFS